MNGGDTDESVLVLNFRNEIADIVSTIREAKSRKLGDSEMDAGGQIQCEVGCFGVTCHKLQHLKRRVREQLSFSSALELLVQFGDAFFQLQECTASMAFFHAAITLFEGSTKRQYQDHEIYIRAAYAHALSRVRLLKAADPCIAYPSTLRELVDVLHAMEKTLCLAVQLALDPKVQDNSVNHAKFVAHVLNGTTHIMGVCTPMKTLGFEAAMLPFIKLAALVLDSVIQLCTLKYCLWRCHIYVTVAECYDALARKHPTQRERLWKSALLAIDHGVSRVAQLRREVELDPPVSDSTIRVLKQADDKLQRSRFVIQKLIKATATAPSPAALGASPTSTSAHPGQILISLSKDEIQVAFPNSESRLLVILASLDKLWKPQSSLNLLRKFEVKPPFALTTSDTDGIATYASSLAADTKFTDGLHICTLKLLFRFRKWPLFVEMYHATKPQLDPTTSAVDATEVDLLFAVYELLENASDRFRLFSVVSHLRQACEIREMCELRHDVLVEIMLFIWHDFAEPMLESLSKTRQDQEWNAHLARDASRVLMALHVSSHELQFDDIVWRGTLALHLANLLDLLTQPRLAIQILRVAQDVMSAARDAMVSVDVHDASVDTPQGLALLSHSAINAAPIAGEDIKHPSPLIQGTMFQQAKLGWMVASIQTEIAFRLYGMELQVAKARSAMTLVTVAKRLRFECNQNGYLRGILAIQLARFKAKSASDEERLLQEALTCFDHIQKHDGQVAGARPVQSQSTPMHSKPRAPLLVSRGSTFVTIEIVPYNPRGVHIAYYCVFGKGTGAGTDVSLNNMEFPGTGTIRVPTSRPTLATVSGLLPNESYVFAVAAYDAHDQVVEGIGATSAPILTLNPLVLTMCYGILAKEAANLNHIAIATKAAATVYTEFVSLDGANRDKWRCSPLFSHALRIYRAKKQTASGVIMQYPMQVVHMFFTTMLILIDAEVDHPPDSPTNIGRPVVYTAVYKAQVTEAIGKCMICLEVACLTDQSDFICTISHKMYQLMVPMLRHVQTGRLLLQAMCLLVQSLQLVPTDQWDDSIYEVYMCASYEVLRIATASKEDKVAQIALKLRLAAAPYNFMVAPFHVPCKEAAALRDAIFLSRTWSAAVDLKPDQHGDGSEGDKGPKKTTPRDDKPLNGNQTRIEDVLQWTNVSATKAIAELKSHFAGHKSFMAFMCRVIKLGMANGERNVGDSLKDLRWHSSLELSPEANHVLHELGAGHLHVEASPPTPHGPDAVIDEPKSEQTDIPKPIDVCNRDVYLWSGEYFYLMGLTLHAGLNAATVGNPLEGPDHDISWQYFATPPLVSTDPPKAEHDPKVEGALTNLTTASQFFYHARAWTNLQACVQTVWNMLWAKWLSPASFQNHYDWRSLYILSMRFMDMLDMLSNNVAFDDANVIYRSTVINDMDERASNAPPVQVGSIPVDIDIPWAVKFVTYAIQVLCTAGEWERLVLLGKRVYDLTGSEHSDQVLPWVVYAQSQRCDGQRVAVATATDDLSQYVKTFEELQAKKKKKKSRLVVHEVITEEERNFREERELKEIKLRDLIAYQMTLQRQLVQVKTWLEHATRSKNMCLQVLHRTQKAVTKQYLCHDKAKDILAGFKSTISLCRQKRATLLLVQVLQEQGDYLFGEGDIPGAAKSWNDGIDAVFGALAATTNWRSIVPEATLRIDGDNMWVIIMCCNMLGKLAWISLHDNLNQRLEYALMSSAAFCKLFTCALQHPNVDELHTFSNYTIYPDFASLASKPLRYIQPASILLMSTTTIETLLTNGKFAQALPLACGMQYFASRHFHDTRGEAQAKRMKFEACVGMGHMDQAVCILSDLLSHHSMALEQSKRIGDPANEALHKWLLEFSVGKLVSDCKLGSRLAYLLSLSVLRWIMALALNESTSPQGIALKRIANQVATHLQASATGVAIAPAQGDDTHTTPKEKSTPRVAEPDAGRSAPTAEKLHVVDQTKVALECMLAQSILALQEGLADAARAHLQTAMKRYRETTKATVDDTHFDCVSSDLGVLFWLRCRIQWIKCDLMQGHVKAAIEGCQIAAQEAQTANEAKFRREIQALHFQALVLEGSRGDAEKFGMEWLKNDDAFSPTTTRVEVLLLLSYMLNTKAAASTLPESSLLASLKYTQAALDVMNAIMKEHGWIGLHSTPSQHALVNVYHPHTALYVAVKAHVVSAMLALHDTGMAAPSLALMQSHVEDGLRALAHVSLPDPKLKATLLYFRGCVMRRQDKTSHECIPFLVDAMQIWVKDGRHPRKLMHRACMELVQVYGETNHATGNDKDKQAQAAYHYLVMACTLMEQLHVLWHTTQVHVVTATALDKLSAPVQHEILSAAKALNNNASLDHVGFLIVPYLMSLQRELDVIYDRELSSAMHQTMATLHTFLLHNHSVYSKHCFQSLTAPPKDDPEIPGGLICAQWVNGPANELVLYFALGTATNATDQRFTESPILSRKAGLHASRIQALKASVAGIRLILQDKDDKARPVQAHFDDLMAGLHGVLRTNDSDTDAPPSQIPCTIVEVNLVERLLDTTHGVNAVHNGLCYALRNALHT
ncbi:hypothetical protein H310_02847 [Aphanomyces invadans]|uniref:Fibronectin type-III domain-containing protein n=1 Tax=Aphanomyces invadans TaxID=157072 RepID=A0A024ULB7_9STRA|nr:hypothetical protein H310_02847 [Aphanomyces invadans]ETW06662.1 hypothetical protein H310_02847 [Aphanomyces invadans]|eukprot:XP_008864737.1 hypothetical protein H310_02847 [Aphanomyces invadans]